VHALDMFSEDFINKFASSAVACFSGYANTTISSSLARPEIDALELPKPRNYIQRITTGPTHGTMKLTIFIGSGEPKEFLPTPPDELDGRYSVIALSEDERLIRSDSAGATTIGRRAPSSSSASNSLEELLLRLPFRIQVSQPFEAVIPRKSRPRRARRDGTC